MRHLLASSAIALIAAGSSAAVVNDEGGFSLTVAVDEAVTSADRAAPAVLLGGDGATVENSGLIAQEDSGKGGYAVAFEGDAPTLNNAAGAVARSGDRAIEHLDGTGMVVNNAGEIFSRRQGVRAGVGRDGATLNNSGLIEALNGRAVQFRAAGAVVINSGELRGGEEVLEAREDFTLENSGLIAIRGLDWDAAIRSVVGTAVKNDEDGVQFASGRAINSGVILSSDDGVDFDEGLLRNSGVIVSVSDDDDKNAAAVDIDSAFEPGVGDTRPNGLVRIENSGYMEGTRAVAVDDAAENAVEIVNSGTMRGRAGDDRGRIAVEFAPAQGESSVTLTGAGVFDGDVLFGAGGGNVFALTDLAEGAGVLGVVRGRGDYDVSLDGLSRGDILGSVLSGESLTLTLVAGAASADFAFLNPTSILFGGASYTAAAFDDYVSGGSVAPVPLPAALPMIVAAFAGLSLMRRRV